MRSRHFIGLGMLFWVAVACVEQRQVGPVVDWVAFLRSEEARLAAEKPSVEVTYVLNGLKEDRVGSAVDWSHVFDIFLADSLSAFTLERAYERTERVSERDSFVGWELPRTGRKPYAIGLTYVRGTDSLIYVQLVNKIDNLLYSSFQEVVYRPGDSLLIRGYNQMPWGTRDSYEQLIRFGK